MLKTLLLLVQLEETIKVSFKFQITGYHEEEETYHRNLPKSVFVSGENANELELAETSYKIFITLAAGYSRCWLIL